MSDHAVIVEFHNFAEKFWSNGERSLDPLYALEDQLIARLETSTTGELEGHDIAVDGSDGTLFLYGPNADALFAVIKPILLASAVTRDAIAVLRYGGVDDPEVRQTRIAITPQL